MNEEILILVCLKCYKNNEKYHLAKLASRSCHVFHSASNAPSAFNVCLFKL